MTHTKLRRSSTSHKGENGRVLIIGGSIDYSGAVYLAGAAAFRAGADNVTIVAPEKVAWVLNTLSPDLITIKIKGDYLTGKTTRKIVELAKKFDAVVIGNGLGRKRETQKFARDVSRKISGLKVIDADAIKAIKLQDVANAILTPHKKEYEILLKNSKCSEKNVKKAMGSNVIVIKGKTDKIISKKKTALNKTGHAGMTVSGTGDVLAGLTAGILAQQGNLFNSAKTAAYINGKIGEKLAKKYGYGYTASDMLELIGKEVYHG